MDPTQLQEQIALIFQDELSINADDPVVVSLLTRISNRIDALIDQVGPRPSAPPPAGCDGEGG